MVVDQQLHRHVQDREAGDRPQHVEYAADRERAQARKGGIGTHDRWDFLGDGFAGGLLVTLRLTDDPVAEMFRRLAEGYFGRYQQIESAAGAEGCVDWPHQRAASNEVFGETAAAQRDALAVQRALH